jgi:hypothetical protein
MRNLTDSRTRIQTKPKGKNRKTHKINFRLTVAAQQTRTSYLCCPTRSSSRSHVVLPSGCVEFANIAGRRRRRTLLLGDNASKSTPPKLMWPVEDRIAGVMKMIFSTFAQVGRACHSRARQRKEIRISVLS